MLCKGPYAIRGMLVPCTRCLPCRFNRRRMWTFRMVLETLKHGDSSFLTLTYDDNHLPAGGTLVPRDAQLFIKRLRKALDPIKIRYFLVGEYGDTSNRPHYHAALFGVPLSADKIVQEAWGKGHVMLGDLNLHSAQYIAGYTVKKMTQKEDVRLNGRHPEFARMSLRPGIGALAVEDIYNALRNPHGIKELLTTGDVPLSLKMGNKTLPLGRYIRRKLRARLGIYNENTGEIGSVPQTVLDSYKNELQTLYENSIFYEEGLSLKDAFVAVNKQKVLNLETRTKIYQSRRSL